MKKILFSLLALTLIAGCSSKPAETTPTTTPESTDVPTTTPDAAQQPSTGEVLSACEVISDNDTVITTFNGTDGVISEIRQEIHYGITEDRTLESLKKSIEADAGFFKGIDGVTYEIIENEKEVIQTVTYQLDKMDEETLALVGMDALANTDGKFIKDDVVKVFEDMGATCK
ncbi:hypothetical protein [Anaerorhabdus sp.]|jgi:uncharacterized lipoprotein YehR (DUF1307 family)|uniref:hypothetical protein n=1 Tax=Anaerorhabdus sp. TaxID=1872524 RepID=UPI002FC9A9B8